MSRLAHSSPLFSVFFDASDGSSAPVALRVKKCSLVAHFSMTIYSYDILLILHIV